MVKWSKNEEITTYFLFEGKTNDLLVYFNKRSELLWVIQTAVMCTVVAGYGMISANTIAMRGMLGIGLAMFSFVGILYWYFLNRFESKIYKAVQEAKGGNQDGSSS